VECNSNKQGYAFVDQLKNGNFEIRVQNFPPGKTVPFEVCRKIGSADKPEGLEPVKT